MRLKSLIAEIESIFDESQEQIGDGASPSGPHLNLNLPVSIKIEVVIFEVLV